MGNIPVIFQEFLKSYGVYINRWLIGGLGWCVGVLGFPSERDCYLGAPRFES